MKNSLSDMTNIELVKSLKATLTEGANALQRAAGILVEMHNRKMPTPSYNHGALRWFREIDSGQLSPHFVNAFCFSPEKVKAGIGVPLATQERWADGAEIQIVEKDATGKAVTKSKPLIRMSTDDMRVVFGAKGVRPLKEQKKMLTEGISRNATTVSPVYCSGPGKITIRRAGTYSVGELSDALVAAGFKRPTRARTSQS